MSYMSANLREIEQEEYIIPLFVLTKVSHNKKHSVFQNTWGEQFILRNEISEQFV